MFSTLAKFMLAGLAALALPAAAAGPAPAAATGPACAAGGALGFASQQAAASLLLAQYAQPMAAQPRQGPARLANPGAEVAAVRNQARRLMAQRSLRAQDEAMRAVAAVANYRGRDPVEMNRLLARVDSAADRLHASLTAGGGSSAAQTGAFQCNADRRECKEQCQADKGKACCCGCGVSFVACLVLG